MSDLKIALIMPKGDVFTFKNRSILFKHQPDSLTLCSLYGIIKASFPDIDIEIYDETVQNINITKVKADIVGISAITPAIKRAYQYAEYFQKNGTAVFIGGVHATLNPDEAFQHCDSVICGLADETLPMLLKDFLLGGKQNLKKIYYQPDNMSFSNLALPERHIYENKNILATELNMVQATYGCSNICEFCVQPYVCRGYHQRPIKDVIKEIKTIDDNYIEFIDPNLSRDEDYLKTLCEELIPLKKRWFAPVTVYVSKNDNLLKLMKMSGCEGVLIGFESVNQESVKSINKSFNKVEEYKECIEKLHALKIKVTGSFVIGLDSDDENTLQNTLDFVISAKIDYVRYTINTPFPGTKYFEKLQKQNRILEKDWNLYDCRHCVIKPAKLSCKQVEKIHRDLWFKTYSFINILKRTAYKKSILSYIKDIIENYVFGKVYIHMMFPLKYMKK